MQTFKLEGQQRHFQCRRWSVLLGCRDDYFPFDVPPDILKFGVVLMESYGRLLSLDESQT